ncbi:hypothetical protein GUJ93_ZPchr0001g29416 [Zizania palustris]|uniref:Reverse transcriptase zinc-binding domain-containing protein n=1 Tax=Zizania palustris TaxID=103762 RepID=A0A8J5V2C3_ZIZPA|nr:hypothetical protein GUJ93_ZPchr0001g29416 [Zizania palustris]
MNVALMGKWLWKLDSEEGLWHELLRSKYIKNRPLTHVKSKCGDSQFWKTLMNIKHLYRQYCFMKIGDGKSTSFWYDFWIGAKPLCDKFSDLFGIAVNKMITVAEVLNNNFTSLKFRRDLIGDKFHSWMQLKDTCSAISLRNAADVVVWVLSKSGVFTVKSFYLALKTQNIMKTCNPIWNLKIPLKVKIFLWLARRNKILTKDNLSKRGWKGENIKCLFCCENETVNHIFLDCAVARFVWRMLYICFNVGPFISVDSMWHTWSCSKDKSWRSLSGVGLAAVLWSLWKVRNDAVFRGNFPTDPLVFINLICYWLSSWSILQRSEVKAKKLELGVRLLEHLASEVFSQRHGWNFVKALL